jgi:hypothetical protein
LNVARAAADAQRGRIGAVRPLPLMPRLGPMALKYESRAWEVLNHSGKLRSTLLTKFPWPERIWRLLPAEGLEPATPLQIRTRRRRETLADTGARIADDCFDSRQVEIDSTDVA